MLHDSLYQNLLILDHICWELVENVTGVPKCNWCPIFEAQCRTVVLSLTVCIKFTSHVAVSCVAT